MPVAADVRHLCCDLHTTEVEVVAGHIHEAQMMKNRNRLLLWLTKMEDA